MSYAPKVALYRNPFTFLHRFCAILCSCFFLLRTLGLRLSCSPFDSIFVFLNSLGFRRCLRNLCPTDFVKCQSTGSEMCRPLLRRGDVGIRSGMEWSWHFRHDHELEALTSARFLVMQIRKQLIYGAIHLKYYISN